MRRFGEFWLFRSGNGFNRGDCLYSSKIFMVGICMVKEKIISFRVYLIGGICILLLVLGAYWLIW